MVSSSTTTTTSPPRALTGIDLLLQAAAQIDSDTTQPTWEHRSVKVSAQEENPDATVAATSEGKKTHPTKKRKLDSDSPSIFQPPVKLGKLAPSAAAGSEEQLRAIQQQAGSSSSSDE